MKHKFIITFVTWVLSLIIYIYVCYEASATQEQFLYLMSFGTMVSMIFFCCILSLFSEKSE